MKKMIPIVLLAVAALAGALYWQLREQAAQKDRPRGGSATIEGTEVDIVAKMGARIATITVDEGQRVHAGEVLVTLVCDEQAAALTQAKAQAEAAKAGLAGAKAQLALAQHGIERARSQADAAKASADASASQRGAVAVQQGAASRAAARVKTLAESGAATEQDLDRATSEAAALTRQLGTLGASATAARRQADAVGEGIHAAELQVTVAETGVVAAEKQVEVADASIARAEVALRECTLVAPRDGIVEVRAFEPGEVAQPGMRLLTIVDASAVRATFYLPNADLAVAAPGREVKVVADAMPGEAFAGHVKRVASEAEFTPRNVQTRDDRDRLVYAVEVDIPNPDGKLRPGMPVEIEVKL